VRKRAHSAYVGPRKKVGNMSKGEKESSPVIREREERVLFVSTGIQEERKVGEKKRK